MKTFNSLTVAVALLCVGISVLGRAVREERAANTDGEMTAKEELHFSGQEAKDFEKFKGQVTAKIPFAEMRKEIVLARFFRAFYLEIDSAVKGVLDAVKWRQDNHMEHIHKEDLKKARKLFESCTDSVDLQGRPILYMQTGKWKLKTAINKGEGPVWERTWYQLMNEVTNKAVAAYDDFKENAQYTMLLNYDKWTTEEGACVDCISIVSRVAMAFDGTWPLSTGKILLINVDSDFHLFLDIIRLVLSKETNAKLMVYGRKRDEWWGPATDVIAEDVLKKFLKEK